MARAIDGDELLVIERLLDTDAIRKSKTASWLLDQVLHDIQASPTIDPETFPIVRQLREQLEWVMKERDAAVSALKLEHDCNFCANDCVNPEQDYCALCHSKECMCRTCKDGSNWAFQFPQKEE